MAQPSEEELKNMSPEQIAEMQKQNCIFCKIIAGEIPSKKVYEDDNFVGILDINPAAQGHVLILPKKHFQILPQIPQDLVGKLGISAKNVSSKVLKAFQSDGTSIFVANGMIAGQKSPHFIMHVIPRNELDNVPLNPPIITLNDSEFMDAVKKIKMGLGVPVDNYSKQKTTQKNENVSEDSDKSKNEISEKEENIEDKNNKNNDEDDDKKENNDKTKDNDTDSSDDNSDDEVDLDTIAKLFT